MKTSYIIIFLFTITSVYCQQKNEETNLSKIARSEDVGKYIIASQSWLLDQYTLFKLKPKLQKESEIIFMNNSWKKKCDWEIDSINVEIRNLIVRECECIKMKDGLFEKYPTLKNSENFNLMMMEALENNSFFLNSDVSDQHEYLKKN